MVAAGGFSLVNENLREALARKLADFQLEYFDARGGALGGRPFLRGALMVEAMARFPGIILGSRIPPGDLILRLAGFQRALEPRIHAAAGGCAFTFQTQSLFDASTSGVPHFLFTDHTFLANRRYTPPRKTWPVTAAWRRMERELYPKCRVCFTSSRFSADSLVEDYGVPESRVMVVGSGANIDLPDCDPGYSRAMRRVIFVGVEWERKGGPVLIEAMQEVRKIFPDATLDVIGCDPGISFEWMHSHGRIPREQVGGHLRNADIFCLPSLAEPSAVALVEASGYGLPVVATRVGGTPERVRHDETGLLVKPGNAPALAEALLSIMKNPEKSRDMGLAGRRWAIEEFTWKATARKIAARIEQELT